ncbi:MAG TPA: uridine diphosphate-N-acetylglucosamine-binding protein YvcK [Actinocrinis sp.]
MIDEDDGRPGPTTQDGPAAGRPGTGRPGWEHAGSRADRVVPGPAEQQQAPGASMADDSARLRGGGPAVVAFGGGHGLYAGLSALRRVTGRLTAVVTVADDGGSSGRIRQELAVLPPGDLRMALAALCGDDEWGRTWARAMQHRFSGTGELAGHALGNLLIVALWEQLGDPVGALDWVGRLLGAQGRVLPMSAVPLEIEACVRGGDPDRPDAEVIVRGQHALATAPGEVMSVRLLPENPPAVPEAVAAIEEADWVVFGPGSWFTSVLPHLMVPQLADALNATRARRLLVLNLVPQAGETDGYTPADHVEVFAAHAPKLRLDGILVDPRSLRGPREEEQLAAAAASLGARVHAAEVAADGALPRHDPARLAEAFRAVFGRRPPH